LVKGKGGEIRDINMDDGFTTFPYPIKVDIICRDDVVEPGFYTQGAGWDESFYTLIVGSAYYTVFRKKQQHSLGRHGFHVYPKTRQISYILYS